MCQEYGTCSEDGKADSRAFRTSMISSTSHRCGSSASDELTEPIMDSESGKMPLAMCSLQLPMHGTKEGIGAK